MSQINFISLRGRARNFNRRPMAISYSKNVAPVFVTQETINKITYDNSFKNINQEPNKVTIEIKNKEINPVVEGPNIVIDSNTQNIKHVIPKVEEPIVIPKVEEPVVIPKVEEPIVIPKVEEPIIDINTLDDEKVLDNKGNINNLLDEIMCWLDANDVNSFQSSAIACNPDKKSEINTWKDKTTKGNNMNKYNSTIKPSFVGINNIRNGGIFFNKFNMNGLEINFARYSNNLTASPFYTQFIVFEYENSGVDSTIWSSNNGDFTIAIDGITKELKISTPKLNRNSFNYNVSTGIIIERNKVNLLTLHYDGTKDNNSDKLKLRFNDKEIKLTFNEDIASSIEIINKLAVGMDVFNNSRDKWYSGYINEVILYKKALNLKSITQIENKLKTKWKL
jgi:hypothetical protein